MEDSSFNPLETFENYTAVRLSARWSSLCKSQSRLLLPASGLVLRGLLLAVSTIVARWWNCPFLVLVASFAGGQVRKEGGEEEGRRNEGREEE